MIIGRVRELNKLERLYAQPGFQLAVISGRPRSGKTMLLCEFLRDRRGVYFSAAEFSEPLQFAQFTQAFKDQLPDEQTKYLGAISGFEGLFSWVAELAKTERLVLAIDDYPVLAKSCPALHAL